MGKLSNQQLREQSMRDFLNKIGISNEDIIVSSIEGLFSYQFKSEEEATQFASDLVNLLTSDSKPYKPNVVELNDIFANELKQATCADKQNEATHRQACEFILGLIKSQAKDSGMVFKDGLVEFTLPNPSYAAMLKNLNYNNIQFTHDNKMLIDIKPYIEQQEHGVVFLKGLNADAAPLVFLSTKTLDAQKIIFKKEALPEGKEKVTPFFFVPQSQALPTYSFMLDMSGSMQYSLPQLKNSVLTLASQLFDYQPNARIQLNIFSDEVQFKGEFTKNQYALLESQVRSLNVIGGTALYDAAANRIQHMKLVGNNTHVLLFTDGGEVSSVDYNSQRLSDLLNSSFPTGALSTVRNKFYLINFNTDTNAAIKEIVDRFQSQIIDTNSAAFVEAMGSPQKLREWAATRDLFTSHLYVTAKDSDTSTDDVQTMAIDLSGQIAELNGKILSPGEQLSIVITDGDGNTVVKGEVENIVPEKTSSYSPKMFRDNQEELEDSQSNDKQEYHQDNHSNDNGGCYVM